MTHCTPPPTSTPLACQQDPQRWFDRRDRTDTLAGCLQCVARRWCAAEALKCRASFGMWAGIWIDGRHRAALPYLQAIATDNSAPTKATAAITSITRHHPPAPEALRRPVTRAPARSAPSAVLARSSGHCEVLTKSCRYTYDRLVSRCRGRRGSEKPSATELFAACAACAETLAHLDPQLATRLGYLVEAGRDPASVPFHWRGSRWVLLDRDGWLTELRQDAQSA